MKFVHVADLHLGKVIHQYSLLDVQKQLLDELLEYMISQEMKVLVIAGDIYDRSVPSSEAVSVLDEFLSKAVIDNHIKVLMISGNHDSHERLHFASSLLKKQGLYIETEVHEEFKPVVVDDVNFYLLPFFKPSVIRQLYNDDNITSYQEALEKYLSHQSIDKNKKNILVTHQFVGKNSVTSDSEMTLTVGGSEIVDASLFDDFDYVALGHLHAPQKVKRETMRYSGSLMRYSFDEVKQDKSICIVETNDFSVSFHSLTPYIDLNQYKGLYEECMKEDFISKKDDLISLELLDKKIVPHAIDQLRSLYPNILQISYPYFLQNNNVIKGNVTNVETMDISELFNKFYKYITNDELDEESMNTIHELLDKVGENDENTTS